MASPRLAEVLRVYEAAGVGALLAVPQRGGNGPCRHRSSPGVYGEVPAVVTSIGPGALAGDGGLAGRRSNGVGVYHLYGDETTHGEGYNMQQVPKPAQGVFGQITALMGASYTLHTPAALRDGLRKGAATRRSTRGGPGRSS